MRIGVLGCGSVVRYCHLPALRRIRSVEVAAVADADPEAFARAGIAGIPMYSRYQDVLDRDDVDAVVIALPSHMHADAACAAAVRGKRIYLEKPVATTLSDAVRVLDAVERNGVVAVVGFNRRRHPLYEQARLLLRSGRIGRVHVVRSAFCEPAPPSGLPRWKHARASGGGALLDLFSHHADLLRWFLDDEVRDVSGTTSSGVTEGDTARVELTMCRGVVAQGFYSFASGLVDCLEFIADGGVLRVDRHAPRLTLQIPRRGYGLRKAALMPSRDVAAWWVRRVVRRSEDPSYFHALRAFAEPDAASSGGLASVVDGLRSLEAVVAAEASAMEGRIVAVEPR